MQVQAKKSFPKLKIVPRGNKIRVFGEAMMLDDFEKKNHWMDDFEKYHWMDDLKTTIGWMILKIYHTFVAKKQKFKLMDV